MRQHYPLVMRGLDLSSFVYLLGCGLTILALLLAGLSFTLKSKRHWSVAACVVNGLLLLWILYRMQLL